MLKRVFFIENSFALTSFYNGDFLIHGSNCLSGEMIEMFRCESKYFSMIKMFNRRSKGPESECLFILNIFQ